MKKKIPRLFELWDKIVNGSEQENKRRRENDSRRLHQANLNFPYFYIILHVNKLFHSEALKR